MRVDIWSDVVCPFCYIGRKRLEAAAEQAGLELEVHWHSYELDPEAPVRQEVSNSERLAQKYGRTLTEVEEMQRNICRNGCRRRYSVQLGQCQFRQHLQCSPYYSFGPKQRLGF